MSNLWLDTFMPMVPLLSVIILALSVAGLFGLYFSSDFE